MNPRRKGAKMKVRDLFESGVMHEDDDFIIGMCGTTVVDNRDRIDDSLKDYLDRDIERIYSFHGTVKIRIF